MTNNYVAITEYSINLNSINRDVIINNSPFDFITRFDDLRESFKKVKYISIDHITFPSFVQIIKQNIDSTDVLYNDINLMFCDLDSTINEQYEYNGNTYEICNINVIDDCTFINFTMNENKLLSYEYVKTSSSFNIYKYIPIDLNSVANTIQYISINPLNNIMIHNTHGHNMFKYVLPKLKTDTQLYYYLKNTKTVFRDTCLQNIKKMQITILDSNSNIIKLNNIDNKCANASCTTLNEPKDYSSPSYYLRHPLNPRFQIDIFLRIGCYEQELKSSIF